MDLYRIIRELMQERDRLERVIHSLETNPSPDPVGGRSNGKLRAGRIMDETARVKASERMKRYWAQRKAEENGKST